MTLEEHARAIESAIKAAADDGYELDNGCGTPLLHVELNRIEGGVIVVAPEIPQPISVPYSFY
jgi:hypothetical protein